MFFKYPLPSFVLHSIRLQIRNRFHGKPNWKRKIEANVMEREKESMVISNGLFYQQIEWHFGWHETKSREIIFTISFWFGVGVCEWVCLSSIIFSILSLSHSPFGKKLYYISNFISLNLFIPYALFVRFFFSLSHSSCFPFDFVNFMWMWNMKSNSGYMDMRDKNLLLYR